MIIINNKKLVESWVKYKPCFVKTNLNKIEFFSLLIYSDYLMYRKKMDSKRIIIEPTNPGLTWMEEED